MFDSMILGKYKIVGEKSIGILCDNYSYQRCVCLTPQPQILKPDNLNNIKVMTLNDAMDPAARMYFYGTLLAVCKLSVKFRTLLQPSGNVDQLWSMEGYATCLQNMEDLVHFDPSRTTFQIPSQVLHFESARNLQVSPTPTH